MLLDEMKEKRRSLNSTAKNEWEKLLEANIYMGDHMTRSWTKDGRSSSQTALKSVPGTPDTRIQAQHDTAAEVNRPGSLKKAKEVSQSTGTQSVKPQVSFRKRRIKSGKELLMHCSVTLEDIAEWHQSFDALLTSTAGRFVFRVFLESEIADENLKFWLACENLKSATKQKRIEKGVQDIYDTYINVYSPHEVNIDYKMRESIVDQLKDKMDVSIFTEAQHQIYTLMHRDSYPRFLCSNLTAEITKELVEQSKRNGDVKQKTERSFEFISCCCCRRQRSVRGPLGVVEEQPCSLNPVANSRKLSAGEMDDDNPRLDSNSSSDDEHEEEHVSSAANEDENSAAATCNSAMNGTRPLAPPLGEKMYNDT
ncbi:uncharacterized protein LOC100182408 isoform X2 [Ciona intestinalis]